MTMLRCNWTEADIQEHFIFCVPMRRDYVVPDDVSGDMQEDEIPGGVLSLNLLATQTMVTTGIFPCKEKFPW